MIKLRVTGLDQMARLMDGVSKRDDIMLAEMLKRLEFAKEYIRMKLLETFSHHSDEHFDVQLAITTRNQFRIQVTADEIGTYIYYGTDPHSISSVDPMPLYDGALFARSVSHPGQEAQKDIIADIVANAVEIMWMGDGAWAY